MGALAGVGNEAACADARPMLGRRSNRGGPMPYPRAHYYVLAVIGVIVAGFWPSYFAASKAVPWQFHAHGAAASTWVALVALQSWTAHHNQLPLHRAAGKA